MRCGHCTAATRLLQAAKPTLRIRRRSKETPLRSEQVPIQELMVAQGRAIAAKDLHALLNLYSPSLAVFAVMPPFKITTAATWLGTWAACLLSIAVKRKRPRASEPQLRAVELDGHQSAWHCRDVNCTGAQQRQVFHEGYGEQCLVRGNEPEIVEVCGGGA